MENPALDIMAKEVLFLIVHNNVANNERVFKFNMVASPNCALQLVELFKIMYIYFVNALMLESLGFGLDRECSKCCQKTVE